MDVLLPCPYANFRDRGFMKKERSLFKNYIISNYPKKSNSVTLYPARLVSGYTKSSFPPYRKDTIPWRTGLQKESIFCALPLFKFPAQASVRSGSIQLSSLSQF